MLLSHLVWVYMGVRILSMAVRSFFDTEKASVAAAICMIPFELMRTCRRFTKKECCYLYSTMCLRFPNHCVLPLLPHRTPTATSLAALSLHLDPWANGLMEYMADPDLLVVRNTSGVVGRNEVAIQLAVVRGGTIGGVLSRRVYGVKF